MIPVKLDKLGQLVRLKVKRKNAHCEDVSTVSLLVIVLVMLADLDLAQELIRHVELLNGLTVVVRRDQRVKRHVHAVPYMGNLSYD